MASENQLFLLLQPGFLKLCQRSLCQQQTKENQNVYDPCMYVDDLFIPGTRLKSVLNLKEELCNIFENEDRGDANICFGVEILRNQRKQSLKFRWRAYTETFCVELKKQFKPVSTAIDKQLDITIMQREQFCTMTSRHAI